MPLSYLTEPTSASRGPQDDAQTPPSVDVYPRQGTSGRFEPMTAHDLTDLSRQLRTRRHELAAELERLTEPPAEGANVSFGKRVGDGTTEAVERISSTATARSIAGSIADIDAALATIEAGSYGTCQVCGQPIPAARLEARPATTRCVECASG